MSRNRTGPCGQGAKGSGDMGDDISMGNDNNTNNTFLNNLAQGAWESVAISDEAFAPKADCLDTSALLEGITVSDPTLALWGRDGSRRAA